LPLGADVTQGLGRAGLELGALIFAQGIPMKTIVKFAALASLAALAACGGSKTKTENKADAIVNAGENKADALENQADAVRANTQNQAAVVRNMGNASNSSNSSTTTNTTTTTNTSGNAAHNKM
jgi:hypothetical protein